MLGISKKITIGFVSLAIILFSSGVVSLLELNGLSQSTKTVLEQNKHSMELATTMQKAVQDQNTAIIQMIITDSLVIDSTYMSANIVFDNALKQATKLDKDLDALQKIYQEKQAYISFVDTHLMSVSKSEISWFIDNYKTYHRSLTSSINNYLIGSQESLSSETESLESSAYRAITPGILTLGVGIIVLLMFLFFINTYVVWPIVAMEKSLKNFINRRLPFQVKMEGSDEVHSLKEHIEDLVNICKHNRI